MIVSLKANPTPRWKVPTNDDVVAYANRCSWHFSYQGPSEAISRKCILEKLELFDETNGFNVERIVEIEMHKGIDANVARSIAEKCSVKKNQSESNWMWTNRGYDCLEAEAKNCFFDFDSVSGFEFSILNSVACTR